MIQYSIIEYNVYNMHVIMLAYNVICLMQLKIIQYNFRRGHDINIIPIYYSMISSVII